MLLQLALVIAATAGIVTIPIIENAIVEVPLQRRLEGQVTRTDLEQVQQIIERAKQNGLVVNTQALDVLGKARNRDQCYKT